MWSKFRTPCLWQGKVIFSLLSSLFFWFLSCFHKFNKGFIDKLWIAPLVNGILDNFFQASRGLRQGFPLSLFLYILMVVALSKKLTAGKNEGIIPGIHLASGVEAINHALFVDDTFASWRGFSCHFLQKSGIISVLFLVLLLTIIKAVCMARMYTNLLLQTSLGF